MSTQRAPDAPRAAMPLRWNLKGLPDSAVGLSQSDIASLNLNVLREDLPLPAALLRRSALDHNRGWMRRFLAVTGAALCPHGKTTMSPEIFRMQLEDGAWGITAATAHHVRVYRRLGIGRILLANQLVGRANIDMVIDEIERDPTFDFYCLVDSIAVIEALAQRWLQRGAQRPIQVLLEVGARSGRAGVRSLELGQSLAAAVAARAPALSLRGIETFEGIFQPGDVGTVQATEMINGVVELARRVANDGLFAESPVILSAGGSAFFDLAARSLARAGLPMSVQVVVRSGCYVTHDNGMYNAAFEHLMSRTPELDALGRGLEPALEVWGYVQSMPEPGLLIASVGKRDVSYDAGLPVPRWWSRPGSPAPVELPAGHHVNQLNDQHAYVATPADCPLQLGDLIGFGISHPCTTFDKWRALYVVDDDYTVTQIVTTLF